MIRTVMNGKSECIWIATIIWYTCVVIAFRQIKQALTGLLLFKSSLYDHSKEDEQVVVFESINYGMRMSRSLPERRFEDMEGCDEAQMCSICLVEFQKEDAVSQVSRCGHVFHAHCIHKWIERDEFTCPLCRSFLFHVDANSPFIY